MVPRVRFVVPRVRFVVPRVRFVVPRVGFAVVLVPGLVLGAAAQEPRFADLLMGPNRTGERARGCCALRGNEIVGRGITVRQLIEAAYRRHAFDRREVIGGPAWIDEERFDFTAQVAGGHVFDRSGFAAQTFATLRAYVNHHGRLRTEARQRPVYVLTRVSQDSLGPRLTASMADCAAQIHAQARGEKIDGRPCGAAPYPGRLVAHGVTLPDLAALLSPHLDRPVVDRTGLDGLYDVDLEAVEFKPAGPFGPSYRPSDTKMSIVDSIQRQLGLRLERATAAIEVVVVEDVERP
jgi:uncharacterized protein (TIGR03435 family)